ncbi:MAG TPA: hypothetical protein VF167_03860 [Longimicrobiaceae bacterium]
MAIAPVIKIGLGGLVALALLAPIALLAAPFMLVSGLARWIARQIEPRVVGWQQIMTFDPALGWRPAPALDTHCLSEPYGEIFHVTTDQHGWRGRRSLAASRIVVLGDSFAFGYGVDDEDCFTAALSEHPTKAVGAPGYNMVQELILLREIAPLIRGKLVVWFVYVGNDLFDNLNPTMTGYRTPFLAQSPATGAWEMVTRHLRPERVLHNADVLHRQHREMLGHTYCSTRLTERAFSACRHLLNEGSRICREAGARLVVLTLPDHFELSKGGLRRLRSYSAQPESFDPDLPHKRVRQICDELGVECLSARHALRASDYNAGDRHWTPAGHRRVAELIRGIARSASESSTGHERQQAVAAL